MPSRKDEQMFCKFISVQVPDIHRLSGAPGLRRLSDKEQAAIVDNSYACSVTPQQARLPDAMCFLFLQLDDNKNAPDFLKSLLENEIDCPAEGVYEVFGLYDFIVELADAKGKISDACSLLISKLQAKKHLALDLEPSKVDVTSVYRHWNVDFEGGVDVNAVTIDKAMWFANPGRYRSVKAFMHVMNHRDFAYPAVRAKFVQTLRDALREYQVDESLKVTGDDLLKRIYYCHNQGWLLGLSCRCGDYYRLNQVANLIAGVTEGIYKVRKTTHLVGSILHFAPWQQPVVDGLGNGSNGKRARPLLRPHQPGSAARPGIDDTTYENILKIIRHGLATFETTPATYESFGEEDLRNVVLASLNGHYGGSATAEAFRNKGKTDICIQADDRAAFVAECKMWRGPSELLEAIDQLTGYLTWRDCKTSLILFNRDAKNFTALLEKIPTQLFAHKLCKHEVVEQRKPNEWRFVFRGAEDDLRETIVHVMIANLPGA